MRRSGTIITAAFLVIMIASVGLADVYSPYTSPACSASETNKSIGLQTEVPANISGPGLIPFANELNEIVGDTVYIGMTYWESQHNGTCGRMIDFYPDDPDGPTVHFVYTGLENDDPDGAGTRHVHYNRLIVDGNTFTLEDVSPVLPGYVVDSGSRSGYTTMGFNYTTGDAYPTYHVRYGTGDYQSAMGAELFFLPGVFNESTIPNPEEPGNVFNWPRSVFTYYNGTPYMHTVSTESHPEDVSNVEPQGIYYARSEYVSDHFEVPDEPELITLAMDYGMNIAAEIAVSNDGSRVAIATTICRDFTVHGPVPDDTSQVNNDLYLWISEDGGDTWDWDSYINMTDFIDPMPELLPDSTAANADTFRCYNDCNLYFDNDDVLHAMFTVCGYERYGSDQGFSAFRTSQIYHWDEVSYEYHRVADGLFWNYAVPGAWQRIVNRPSMYQDPETGILWCVFQQYGVEGEYQSVWDEEAQDSLYGPWDASDEFYANGEVMVTASPANPSYFGKLWSKPINITNTRPDGPPEEALLQPGECRNEREPNLALHNEGDYLNIFYVLDLDAGFWIQEDSNGDPEGEPTLNPVIYHRVSKTEILDLMEAQAEWLDNVPLHIDLNGYWEDDQDYAWTEENGGFSRGGIAPPNSQNTDISAGRFELVSMYVELDDMDAANVFSSLEDLNIAKADNGGFYWPQMLINTIGDCDITEGYKVFSEAADTWSMTGSSWADPSTEISLSTNAWNYLGYPFHNQNIDPTVALSEVDVADIGIIQNDDGLFWWPGIGIQTLATMTPGEGYKVYVNNDVTFTYSTGAAREATEVYQFANNRPSGSPKATGQPYIIAVDLSEELMQRNPAIVEAYDGNLLVGKAYVQDAINMAAVVAWEGSEDFGLEGFAAGNPISLRALDAYGAEIPTSLENAAIFGDGYAAQAKLTAEALPREFTVGSAYPNPFNPTVSMTMTLPNAGQVQVKVFNLLGQAAYTQNLQLEAGHHTYTFDASKAAGMASGVYFMQVSFGDVVNTQKIVLMK